MSDPQRHDIFEDENGKRVAIKQVMDPNALGVVYVEYKNLSDSNLRFLAKGEFLERFRLVDNFNSTDTYAKLLEQQQAIEISLIKKVLEKDPGKEGSDTSSNAVDGIETRKAGDKPSRSS